jgi:hypothetical protein
MTGPEFLAAVGHSEDFSSSAPSKVTSYYNDCTTRSILGTNCTATVLFKGGSFTSTGATNSVYLGRQWPQNNSASTGQTIIREVNLGAHIRTTAPWKQWVSTHPIDYGATGSWRLAEYGNTGPGAAP